VKTAVVYFGDEPVICDQCGHGGWIRLHRQLRSGGPLPAVRCLIHKRYATVGRSFYPVKELWIGGHNGRTVWPHVYEWDKNASAKKHCDVCGYLEHLAGHHLAPRNKVGADEAERWPIVQVCHECHKRWHVLVEGRKI